MLNINKTVFVYGENSTGFKSVAFSFSENEHPLAGILNDAADALIQFEGLLEPRKPQ